MEQFGELKKKVVKTKKVVKSIKKVVDPKIECALFLLELARKK